MLHQFDAVTAAPEHHKVLLENDQVRVLETIIKPDEETAVHTHIWSGVLYIIAWSNIVRFDEHRNVMMDSRTLPSTPAVGTAMMSAPLGLHSLKNVGTGNLHVILTEFKA
jgi:hypothetical protein